VIATPSAQALANSFNGNPIFLGQWTDPERCWLSKKHKKQVEISQELSDLNTYKENNFELIKEKSSKWQKKIRNSLFVKRR